LPAVVNVVAVVARMMLTSGFFEFAVHGFRAAHNVVAAQEQARAKHVA
jgi:hypothetical protein